MEHRLLKLPDSTALKSSFEINKTRNGSLKDAVRELDYRPVSLVFGK
jgi:hypothetical protein